MAQMGFIAAAGGETQDAEMEYESLTRASAVTVGSTGARIVSGSRHLTLPMATNAANCTIPILSSGSVAGRVHLFSCFVGTNGTLTSEAGLIGKYANPTTERYVRIGTDNKIRLYDSAGNQVGHTSHHAVSTTGMTHVAVCYDYLSPRSQLDGGGAGAATIAYVTLWVDGKWQWDGLIVVAAGTRLLSSAADDMVWGEDLDAAVNRGVDIYLDDWSYRASGAGTGRSADLPHITQPGVTQVVGGASLPPTAVGTHTAWTTASGGGFADYRNLDDYPNDGATTAVSNVTDGNNAKETYTYSAANPTDSADTIVAVSLGVVGRETAGGKSSYLGLLRNAGGTETTTGFTSTGTAFKGQRKIQARPGGGSWVYTDFDLTAGVSNLQFGMQSAASSVGNEVTSLTGPLITKYEALMPSGRMWN